MSGAEKPDEAGAQRLSLPKLQAWERMRFGMFVHFGMSTFDGDEFSRGDQPSTKYAPDQLDVEQWVSAARDAGCRYAVLTAKHVAGHCLWPSRHTDYHVGTSDNRTDVVEAFVRACDQVGIKAGLYYCSWDNHHRFGSATPTFAADGSPGRWEYMFATAEYERFQLAQLEELCTQYGPLVELWIDIPGMLSAGFRYALYARVAELQPEALVVMNKGVTAGSKLSAHAWPTDVLNYETEVPAFDIHPGGHAGHRPWREWAGKRYYLPGEVCDSLNPHWFWIEGDRPKSDAELLGQALLCRTRGCNQLLNVSPDRRGLLSVEQLDALKRLRRNLTSVGVEP